MLKDAPLNLSISYSFGTFRARPAALPKIFRFEEYMGRFSASGGRTIRRGGSSAIIFAKELMKMTVAQLTVKEDLCRRILDLPVDSAMRVLEFVNGLEEHEPNEETIEVLEDSEAGLNLSRVYDDVEEMLSDLLDSANA
ncbi:MAG: hypothetical protein LBQ90_06625 [Synergistaceae bacterium]|jgi:hypothetical protein|nr:hypothetical protein [Synergistaceae bacterium]